MNLPIRTLGLAAVALLIGSALSPVSAQQQSGVDGQVALRSDGALYLISNGQRRWISTVAATDEDINALPEGDPILAGLSPQGSAQAPTGASKPSTNTSSAASKPAPTKTVKPTTSSGDDDDDDSSTSSDGEELDTDIPITLDIGGGTDLKKGDSRAVEIKTRRSVTCELQVKMPGGDDIQEDSKNADSSGRCKYNIDIPSGAKDGNGEVVGTVREGGNVNRSTIKIKIQK